MTFLNNLFIKLSSKKVGIDEFGNRYFEAKKHVASQKKKKRYVVYNGKAEASKIPAQWHGWMHYYSDIPPINVKTDKRPWQKIHLPNLTGTKYRYSPTDVEDNKSEKVKSGAVYQSWNP